MSKQIDNFDPRGLDAVYWEARDTTRKWVRFHETLSVCDTQDCRAVNVYRGQTIDVHPNQLLIFEPGETHRVAKVHQPAHFAVVEIPVEHLEGPMHFSRMQYDCPSALAALREAMSLERHGGELLATEDAWLAFFESLRQLASETETARRQKLDRRLLDRVKDFVEADLSAPHSIDQLADHVGLSKFSFARRFRQTCHMSPYAFVLERRVARARSLLRSGTPFADVALMCGFADQSHLHRHFRRIVGTTPGAFAASFS